MAARNIKKMDEFDKRLSNVLDKVDYSEMDLGELQLVEGSTDFEPEMSYKVDELIDKLNDAVRELKATKDAYVQKNLQHKLQDVLNEGGSQASELINILYGKTDTNETSDDTQQDNEENLF